MAWSPSDEQLARRAVLTSGASATNTSTATEGQHSVRTDDGMEELILSWNEQTYALRVQRRSAMSHGDGLSYELEIPEQMLLAVFARRGVVVDRASQFGMTARQAPSIAAVGLEAGSAAKSPTLEETERAAIAQAIREADGNLMQATASLGIARSTLYLKLKKYGLDELVTRHRAAERPSCAPRVAPPVEQDEREVESPTSLSA